MNEWLVIDSVAICILGLVSIWTSIRCSYLQRQIDHLYQAVELQQQQIKELVKSKQ